MKAKLPLASKFIGGFVLILLGISTFLFLYFPQNIKETLLEKELINAEVLIDVVSVGAGLALAEGDYEVLGLTINIAKEFPNARYIQFLDVSNESIAVFNPNKTKIDTTYADLRNGTVMLKDAMVIRSPLIYQDQVYGSLILNYSLVNTNVTIAYYRKMIMQLSLFILIIGALIATGLSKVATNPIRKLMEASKKVIHGDLDVEVRIHSKDEFELLGETFNFMLKSIRENSQIEAMNAELRDQQATLEIKNVELEEQSEKMKEQQFELESSNEELQRQKDEVAQKNELLKSTSTTLYEKARQLEISNNFKSEFLANMSHELRSPLNSMLILANDLADNETSNLTNDQVESANIIYDGGRELLTLINDILDLSKIESGKMEVVTDNIAIQDIANEASNKYKHVAADKNIAFEVVIDKHLPAKIKSDGQRIKQIVNNLLSNAIKFTEVGKVTLHFNAKDAEHFDIKVSDTGIGIPPDKQELIFKAFTQADGGTSRKYGGTGLGLAITSQLCALLGGEINIASEEGKGSDFCVTLPITINDTVTDKKIIEHTKVEGAEVSEELKLNENLILIIEDDKRFANVLSKEVVKMGFEVMTTTFGLVGLKMAEEHRPCALILDLGLPDISGLEVLQKLKADPKLRDIPVHVMSVSSPDEFEHLDIVQYITKPIDKEELKKAFEKIAVPENKSIKKVLLVEDHKMTRDTLVKVLKIDRIEIIDVGTLKEAQEIVRNSDRLDGVILDLKLPDGSGKELLDELHSKFGTKLPQIIVYTGKEMDEEEVHEIKKWARSIIIKGEESEKRLTEELSLFLNSKRKTENKEEHIISNNKFEVFVNKTVLVVDDDMRNVFALSKMLVNKGFKVIKASNGMRALVELEKENEIDMVLMDIMMPEMDGYETMRRIRKVERYKTMPIIALTAKAMKDDKEKCISAGANDYMSKPIEIDKLFNLMRVWIN